MDRCHVLQDLNQARLLADRLVVADADQRQWFFQSTLVFISKRLFTTKPAACAGHISASSY